MLTRVPRSPASRVVAAFVLPYLLLGLFWVFANPVAAAPDENDHLVKALGAARFDAGTPGPPAPPGADVGAVRNASITRVVEIPARLDPSAYRCFAFRVDVTAACQPARPAQVEGDRAVPTTLGAYPPFLYPPLGWVAGLGADPVTAIVLGRLVVLATSTVLLWLACAHLVRWLGPRALLGVAVLMTPMAIFCLGILNTSAAEILGALGMAAVVTAYGRHPESLSAARTQVLVLASGTALLLSRQLGIVTMVVLGALLLALGGWRELGAGLRARRPLAWATVLVPAVAAVAVVLWELLMDHPVLLGPWISVDAMRDFANQLPQLAQETVGWFGWLDVRPPPAVNLVWLVAAAVLVVAALVIGSRRDRLVLAGTVVAGVGVAYLTYARVFAPLGGGLQGRHVIPVLAVVPVWAGVVVAERLASAVVRRVVLVGVVLLPVVVGVGLYVNSMRYAVGRTGPPLWFVPEAAWSPPLGWYPWLLVGLVGCLLLGWSWLRALRSTPAAR